jgi:hypothetical protein
MRVIKTIRYQNITVSVFGMNDKYIIKLEAGPMEQAFKVPMNEIAGVEGIEKMLDQEFMQKALDRFNEMYLSFKAAQERLIKA